MFEYIINICSYIAYASLGYTCYSLYPNTTSDMSKISYTEDQYAYHTRLANYYGRICRGGSCKKMD
jgi:hypothetical protein